MITANTNIKSATVCYGGDPSVGISSTYFVIELPLDLSCMTFDNYEELVKYLKEVKAKIKELYQLCDDEGLSVMFDYEIESENKMYEQLEKD